MNQKIKIMNRQPQVSDEEVKGYMDFDGLLHQHKKIVYRRGLMFKSGAAILLLATMVAVYISFTGKSSQTSEEEKPAESLVVTPEGHGQPEVEGNTTTSEKEIVAGESTANESPVPQTAPDDKSSEDQNVSADKSRGRIHVEEIQPESVYVQAEPVDGYDKLFEYFRANLQYPEEALSDSVEGLVTVTFVITPEGKADNITIRNSLGEAFDREATTLISNMPQWKPATLNGKAVPSRVSLPLNFELKKINR